LSKDATLSLVNEAHISQPACTAVQLALTDLLRSWGISPVAVAGHSSGEIGAAYAAGVISLESAMAISYYRGMATKGLKKRFPQLKGSMIAVGGTKEDIEPLLAGLDAMGGKASIACYNSPNSLTISGDEPAIDELQRILEQKQVFNRKLQVDMAYHSHHMDLVAQEYGRCLASLPPPTNTEIQFHSSLLGKLIDASLLEQSYWVDNLTQSVRFSEAVTSMSMPTNGHKTGVSTIIEIGPHSALAGPVKQILKACGRTEIAYSSALTRKRDAVEASLDMASTLFVKGANLDLGAINISKSTPELLIDMPRYPWNHKTRYWHENRIIKQHKSRPALRHDLLGTLATYSNDLEPTWKNVLRIDDLPWLRHHQIQSLILFPMSGFISMAVEAMSQKAADRKYDNFHLREVSVHTPLIITDADVEVTLQLRPHLEGNSVSDTPLDTWYEFKIHSWTASNGWTEHCKGLITVKANGQMSAKSSFAEIQSSDKVAVDKSKFYASLSELGVSYGPSFQGMNDCYASDSCSTATITTIDTSQEMPQNTQTDSVIHAAFLEQLIEMYWPILGAGPGRTSLKTVYLPSCIGDLSISRKIAQAAQSPGDSLRAFCKGNLPQSNVMPFQPSMFATAVDSEEVLVNLKDLTAAPIIERDNTGMEVVRELCYKLEWEAVAQETPKPHANGCQETTNGHGTTLSNGVRNEILNGIANGTNQVHCFPSGELIIIHGDCLAQNQLATELADSFEHLTGNRPVNEILANLDKNNTSGKLCLFIAELNENILSSLGPTQFAALQTVLTGVSGILWVTRGAYVASTNPNANMVTGLSRSIRSETLLKFATLDLDSESSASSTTQTIITVFKAAFSSEAEVNGELEFTERKGVILTPRIVVDEVLNEYVHNEIHGVSVLEPTSFLDGGRHLKMTIGTPGAPESLHFVDQVYESALPEDEIEVEVKAIGMNAGDMTLLDTSKLGIECSGVVARLGESVTNLTVGDRVACLSASCGVYSSYTRTNSAFAFRIPDRMQLQEAASIPVAYCTAYYGLVDIGRLLQNERVIIHGAESAVGQAAIHLAQMLGAEVFATVKNSLSKDYLVRNCGISGHKIFEEPTSSFEHNEESGFDVVLSCTPADADTMRELWGSLDGFGRFIEIKEKESNLTTRLETTSLQRNRSFMSVDLISVTLERPKLMKRLLSNISGLLAKGKIQPIGIALFSISNIEGAFNTLRDGYVDGKLVIVPHVGDQVKVCIPISTSCFPLLSGTNQKPGNPGERQEIASTRCLIHFDRWDRWARQKYGQVDVGTRRSKPCPGVSDWYHRWRSPEVG
jgi:NADPH:quinone reductase-like Zn-dependent oxidoreductase/malonyl CoA-acyl carrier protein transacylase